MESQCYNFKNNVLGNDQVKGKLEANDVEEMTRVTDEALKWLDEHREDNTEQEEFDNKIKEVEDVCNPIMQRVYSQAGGAGGMPWRYARWYAWRYARRYAC